MYIGLHVKPRVTARLIDADCVIDIQCPRKYYIARKRKKTGREYVGSTPDGVFLATEFLR